MSDWNFEYKLCLTQIYWIYLFTSILWYSIIIKKKKLYTLKEIFKSFSNGNIEKYFLLENTFLVYTIKYIYDILKWKSFISCGLKIFCIMFHNIYINFIFFQLFLKKILIVIEHLGMHCRVNCNSMVILRST